jgi:hypothetical protein
MNTRDRPVIRRRPFIRMPKSHFLRSRSVWYWVLAVVPILSYLIAAELTSYYFPEHPTILLPSHVANSENGLYGYSIPAILVVAAIWYISWYAFQRFTKSHRFPRKTFSQIAPLYVLPILGFVSSLTYSAQAFITITFNVGLHCVLHISTLFLLWFFFAGSSVIFAQSNFRPVPNWLWIYDIVTLLVIIGYGVFTFTFPSAVQTLHILTLIAYLALGLVFVRAPIHGSQILGPEFVNPFAPLINR